MANQSLQEILSRLNILGATATGGVTYANYLAVLNQNGQLDPSLFSTTLTVTEIATEGDLTGIATPKMGDLAIIPNTAAWAYTDQWRQIGAVGAANISFDPSATSLAATNVQAAIEELETAAVTIDGTRTVTGLVTFDAVDGLGAATAPFIVGVGSAGKLVTGLNAEKVGGKTLTEITNAGNLSSGTIPFARLTGNYNINISGTSAESDHAASAAAVDNGVTVPSAENANYALVAHELDQAAANSLLLAGEDPSFYRNVSNLNNGGVDAKIPSGLISDASHGSLSGGNLHSVATPSVNGVGGTAGFIAAIDLQKLRGIDVDALTNVPAFSSVSDGTLSPAVSADATHATVTIVGGNSGIIATTADNDAKTLSIDVDSTNLNAAIDSRVAVSSALDAYLKLAGTAASVSTPVTFTTPFAITSSAAIANLNASLLGGHPASDFTSASNLTSGYLGVDRMHDKNTSYVYPINISGVSVGNLPLTGGTITGNLTVEGTVYNTGLGVSAVATVLAAEANGQIVRASSSDQLPEGATNKYFKAKHFYDTLQSMLQNSTDGKITWTFVEDLLSPADSTVTPALGNLTTADVSDAPNFTIDNTRGYLNVDNWAAFVSAKGSAIAADLRAILGSISANDFSTLVARDSAGNIAVKEIETTGITATGNITTTGTVTADKFYDVTTPSTSVAADTNIRRLTDKEYVDARVNQYANPAKYDLPIRTTTELSAAPDQDVLVGQVVEIGGTTYKLINTLPPDLNDGVTTYDGTLTTTAQDGFITSVQFGNLLKMANLVNSPAAASIFCPELRLSEPFSFDPYEPIGSITHKLDYKYTNPNWRRALRNAVQVRGRAARNYLLLFRLQGFVSVRHTWTLTYYTYAGGVYNKHTLAIRTAATAQPTVTSSAGDLYEYVDENYAIMAAGRTNMTLEMEAVSGLMTQPMAVSFDGIAPFVENVNGVTKPYFNGGFVNIKPISVWSANPDEPFSPYTPDSITLQSEGDLIGGGISDSPLFTDKDNRTYDGEDVVDSQSVPTLLTKTTDIVGFKTYTVTTDPGVSVAKEKSCVRCSKAAVNKHLGVNGFLRSNPIVSSGLGLTPPLAASQAALEGMPLLSVSAKLPYPLPVETFSLFGEDISVPAPDANPTFGDLMGTFLSGWGVKSNSYDNNGTPAQLFGFSYDASTDRFTLTINDSGRADPGVYDNDSILLKALRIVYGTNTSARKTGITVLGASGIPDNDSLVLGDLPTTVKVGLFSGSTGSFAVDNSVVEYQLTTTLGQLKTKFTNIGCTLSYNAASNEFVVQRNPGLFTDTASLIAPRIYDINGTLATAMGLEKEALGNAELPSQSVHQMMIVPDGVVLAGDFRSYNGTSSAGIAKIRLNGQLDHKFNPDLGFAAPVGALAAITHAGSTDILVAPDNAASYKGYNLKDIYRLTNQAAESDATYVLESPVSKDNQTRVLGIVTASNGDFIVVTPRKIVVYNEAGTVLNTYTGTKSFHGVTKFSDDGSITKFILASSTYTTPVRAQRFTDLSNIDYIVPAGLRLLNYNQNDGTISMDNVWQQSNAAGVGAGASCAYPIIGGAANAKYVICGNRAGWFNSGIITNEADADWSWNFASTGNLLLQSENLEISPAWYTNVVTGFTVTGGTGSTVLAAGNSTTNGSAYVEQLFDSTYAQWNTSLSATQENPGGIGYELDVELGLQASPTAYAYIVLSFTDNSDPGSPGYTYSVGAQVDLRDTNVGLPGLSRAIQFAPADPPDDVSYLDINVTAVDDLVNHKSIIKITANDTIPNNTKVGVRIYPAYNTTPYSDVSAPATGSLTVYRTALRYGPEFWSPWSGYTGFNIVYDHTTTSIHLPSGGDTNSDLFKGLYKVSLTQGSIGQAWPGFHLDAFTFSEPQSHAIPFATDSANNIYVGGPISKIGANNDVTPWRIYKLSPLGVYNPEDAFNKTANFDGKVTSCKITDADYLIVAGTFSCYNNTVANKLIFLNTDGLPIENIDPSGRDVIEQPTPPTDPALFGKLWLDTSTVPPILKIYDTLAVDAGGNTSPQWVNIVYSNRQLPQPALLIAPPSTAGTLTDPDSIILTATSALNLVPWDATSTTVKDVHILYQIVVAGNNPVLDTDGNIPTDEIYQYTPGDNIFAGIRTTFGITDQTLLTVYAQMVPSETMKLQTTTIVNGAQTSTTVEPSFVFPSALAVKTFTVNPPALTPTYEVSGVVGGGTSTGGKIPGEPAINVNAGAMFTITNVGTQVGETFKYYITDATSSTAYPDPDATVSEWTTYGGTFAIERSCNIFIVGKHADYANSTVVGPIQINFVPVVDPAATYNVHNSTPGNNTLVIATDSVGVLYSLNSAPDPTRANLDANFGTTILYKEASGGYVTFNVATLAADSENIVNDQTVVKVAGVSIRPPTGDVQKTDIVDISAFNSYSIHYTGAPSLTAVAGTPNDYSFGKTGDHATDPALIYITSTETTANAELKYTLVAYNSTGTQAIVNEGDGAYAGTVSKPVPGTWEIDLNTGLGKPPYHFIVDNYRDFDVIYYAYRTDGPGNHTASTVYPSASFFQTSVRLSDSATVPGVLAHFQWTAVKPTITVHSDATWGIYAFSAVSNNTGGQLYYTLNQDVDLLLNPTQGTPIADGVKVQITTDAAMAFVHNNKLIVQVVDVNPEGNSRATAGADIVPIAAPLSYNSLVAYNLDGAAFTRMNTTPATNIASYGTPVGKPLFEVQSGYSVAAIYSDSNVNTAYSALVYNEDTDNITLGLGLSPAVADVQGVYSSSYIGFTPGSGDVTNGEIRLGLRLFAPGMLPSRMMNYTIQFRLAPAEYLVSSQNKLSAIGTISNNDTVVIGSKTYTFKSALTPTEGEVLLGGTLSTAMQNLLDAINHTGTPGTQYSAAHLHPEVTADAQLVMDSSVPSVIVRGYTNATNTIAVNKSSTGLYWNGGGATYTVANATAASTTIAYALDGSSVYSAFTGQFKVYAFKDTIDGRVYSATPLIFGPDAHAGGSGEYFTVGITWNAVTGADGYRIVVADDGGGAALDKYIDTTYTSLLLGVGGYGYDSISGQTGYTAGNTVTPASITHSGTALIMDNDSGNTVFNEYSIALRSPLATATIFYSMDGSIPSTTSDIYSAPILLRANATINTLAKPAVSTGAWLESDTATQNFVTKPAFTADSQLGLINIAFGTPTDDYKQADLLYAGSNTEIEAPIGNSILNSKAPGGFGFTTYGIGVKNCYWNVLNSHNFPQYVNLRDAKSTHNANNQLRARAYAFSAVDFDLTTVITGGGVGTVKHLFTKGIKSTLLDESGNIAPCTLVEIDNLPPGKYAILAMNVSQFVAGATTATNTVDTKLDIVDMSPSGKVLSNVDQTSNPAFYFNAANDYGDIRYFNGGSTSNQRTDIIGRWQVAIIDSALVANKSAISFAISGTNLVCLQILPLIDILQPQVVSPDTETLLNSSIVSDLTPGRYGLMYLHGAVKIPKVPAFTGEGYLMTYKNDQDQEASSYINQSEVARFSEGAGSSKLYSGTVTYFTVGAIPNFLKLQYFNSSITSGDYTQNQVMNSNGGYFPANGTGVYKNVWHGLSYTSGPLTDPAFGSTPGEAIVAPIFGLFSQDVIDDLNVSYMRMPQFAPALRSYIDLANNYTDGFLMFDYDNSTDKQILYTVDGSAPVYANVARSSYPRTYVYTPGIKLAYTEYQNIKAILRDTSTLAESPINSINYFSTPSGSGSVGYTKVAGFNFIEAKSTNKTQINHFADYPTGPAIQTDLVRTGGTSVVPNTHGWLSTGYSLRGTYTDAMKHALGDTTVTYDGAFYSFKIAAAKDKDIRLASIDSLNVFSQKAALGITDNIQDGELWVSSFQLPYYTANGWVLGSGGQTDDGYTNIVHYRIVHQEVTAGPNRVAVLYCPTPAFDETTVVISDMSIAYSGAQPGGVGTEFEPISETTDLAPYVNVGLSLNNITIPAARAGYFRIVPYAARDTQYAFGFVNSHSAAQEDIIVRAYVTSATEVTDTLPSSVRSTITLDKYHIAANGTEFSTITVHVNNYNGAAVDGKLVNLSSSDVTDVITKGDGGAVGAGITTSGGGLAVFRLYSEAAAPAHVSRVVATVADMTNNSVDERPEIRIGSSATSVLLTPDTVVADDTAVITVAITVYDAFGTLLTNQPMKDPRFAIVSGGTGIARGNLTITTTTEGQTATDGTGTISYDVKSNKMGTAVLTFYMTNGDEVTTGATPLTFTAGDVSLATSSVTTTAPTVLQGSSVTANVVLKDERLNPCAGYEVTIPAVSGLTFSTPALTSAAGTTSFTITGDIVGLYTDIGVNVQKEGSLVTTALAGFPLTVTSLPSPVNSTVEVSPVSGLSVGAPGPTVDKATITVTLKDTADNLIGGQIVTVAANGTGNTVSGVTSGAGVYTATISSTKAEMKTISATFNGTAIVQTAEVTFDPVITDTVTSTLTAVSPKPANGTTQAGVTVTLRDEFGNPIPHHVVALTSNRGTDDDITATTAETNTSGIQTFYVVSSVAGNCILSAEDTTDSRTLLASATIVFESIM